MKTGQPFFKEPETNKVIKLDEPEEEETNKVKGKIRTGG
jgi:hypothetical protein